MKCKVRLWLLYIRTIPYLVFVLHYSASSVPTDKINDDRSIDRKDESNNNSVLCVETSTPQLVKVSFATQIVKNGMAKVFFGILI